MRNEAINESLKKAMDSAPIDLLDKIKAMPVEKMEEHDHITRQVEVEKRPNILKPVLTLASAAAVFLIAFLIAYLGWYMPYRLPDSDVNPSIEMAINRKEQVIG